MDIGDYKGLQVVTRDYMVFKKKIELESSLDNLTDLLAPDPNPTIRNTLSTVSLYFEMVGLH